MNGLRRQFLITREANIIVLLKRGMKVESCNDNLRDVTEHVKCKVRSSKCSDLRYFFPPVSHGVGTNNVSY